MNRFARYAWGLLGYMILVILWGAIVRATGSGAGCGSHWPLCNGEVVPQAPEMATLIEFSHRLTSGLAGVLVIGLLLWAFRIYPKGHRVRKGAFWSLVFVITEGAIGAMLVLAEWVALDTSVSRTISIALHLNNTFVLLACLALTAWWASGGRAFRVRGQGSIGWLLVALVVATMVASTAGAITALGDTLFQAQTTAEALARTTGSNAHHLEQLRIYHPLLSVLLSLAVFPATRMVASRVASHRTRTLSRTVQGLFALQLLVGALNVYLKAPVSMQLTHLLVADAIWVTLVLFSAATLAHRMSESTDPLGASDAPTLSRA